MKKRCNWADDTFPEYIQYHDKEWGVPVHDDQTHFEFLILEGAQAGLSWSTILKRRDGYRKAFANFDPEKVARFDEAKVQELLQYEGIIRNKLKVRSAVTNAQLFLEIQEEFGSFDAYIWQFVGGEPIINHWENMKEVPASTKESDALSKDLKKRGFKFTGSTIMYAHMQACGLVMDHTVDCFRYEELNIEQGTSNTQH
ncbi:DNA-3-methyladenine glycosylase I [Gracilimonas tropica]|uniref:DNA-3-methyladenine glycosylase I n=1 Tax=Gracilimonas tropica TaxID=454600 RepID=UPI00036AD534|nr:DNA-3-methyladenine glycosylase I [Gracilimonas tropica]